MSKTMNDDDVAKTAAHMRKLHNGKSYTAYERAIDHAFSYDSDQPQRQYWLDVAATIKFNQAKGL